MLWLQPDICAARGVAMGNAFFEVGRYLLYVAAGLLRDCQREMTLDQPMWTAWLAQASERSAASRELAGALVIMPAGIVENGTCASSHSREGLKGA